jgi:anti-anti-sigma factor
MSVEITYGDGEVTLEPDDAKTPAFGDEIAEAISRLLDEGHRRFVVSFARVETLDSAGLGALVRAFVLVERAGGSLRIGGSDGPTEELLRVTKLDRGPGSGSSTA